MSLRFIAGAALLMGAWLGCSVTNAEHCGNLEGDRTCEARDKVLRFCSLCVGENNGCVAAPIAEADCHMASDSGTPGTSSTGTTTTPPVDPTTGTTLAETTTTGTTDATTTTGTTEATTTTGTTDATTTTGDETTAATTGTSTGTTAGETGETSGSSTGEPEMCGNGMLDEGESCEGGMLGGMKCADFAGYGGGTLKCSAACDYDKSLCCLGLNSACNAFDSKCCGGSTCNLVLGKCVSQ